jgi:hypothetical protein
MPRADFHRHGWDRIEAMRLSLATFALLGAVGGSLRGLIDLYTQIARWHLARRAHRSSRGPDSAIPRLTDYVDVVPEVVAGVVHIALGAAAGALFGGTGQVAGAYAAVLVGASAPALLMQLGQIKSLGDAVTGYPAPAAEIPQGGANVIAISRPERVSDGT